MNSSLKLICRLGMTLGLLGLGLLFLMGGLSLEAAAVTITPSAPRTYLGNGTLYTVTYTSTVDGAALAYHEYLPEGYSPTIPAKLALMLPGSGGLINQYDRDSPYTWTVQADMRDFILLTVQPRELPGYPTYRFTFYMNSALAPGEQDVLDALHNEMTRRLIDPDRIYIGGYSMGGFGALNLAALHPDLFAASAPGAPLSDLFQQWAYMPNAPPPNFATLFGGAPGQSTITDTYWYQNSPRFLLPNLMHTPVRVMHGLSDTFIPNATAIWPYMAARHIVDVPGFIDSRGRALTLQELRTQWPGSYYEEHFWPSADHGPASLFYKPDEVLAFFDAHVRVTNPLTVAFITYENRHAQAYWLNLQLFQPWSAAPAGVYALRNPAANTAYLQVTGTFTLSLAIGTMGLQSNLPLTVTIAPQATLPSEVALVLSGTWPLAQSYQVFKDSTLLPPSAYQIQSNAFTLLRQTANITHTYTIQPNPPPVRVWLAMIQK